MLPPERLRSVLHTPSTAPSKAKCEQCVNQAPHEPTLSKLGEAPLVGVDGTTDVTEHLPAVLQAVQHVKQAVQNMGRQYTYNTVGACKACGDCVLGGVIGGVRVAGCGWQYT